jgi:hypothetical protein
MLEPCAAPATIAIEVEVRAGPRTGIASSPQRGRMWSIHDPIAKSLEPRAISDIEELVPGRAMHPTIMTRQVR